MSREEKSIVSFFPILVDETKNEHFSLFDSKRNEKKLFQLFSFLKNKLEKNQDRSSPSLPRSTTFVLTNFNVSMMFFSKEKFVQTQLLRFDAFDFLSFFFSFLFILIGVDM